MIVEGYPPDAPIFDGHFDGHPIVPGAWLLALAIDAARERLAADGSPLRVGGVLRAKFLRPLGPGVPFEIVLATSSDPRRLRFELRAAGGVCASGLLALATTDDVAAEPSP